MPSIPQSLLWISLVVLWLFVLVPMLISKRDNVRRTSDVALATRVLNTGGNRLRRRSGPAAGHYSDPNWRRDDDLAEFEHDYARSEAMTDSIPVADPEADSPRSVVLVEPVEVVAESKYLDVEVVEMDSGALPVGSSGVSDVDDSDAEVAGRVADAETDRQPTLFDAVATPTAAIRTIAEADFAPEPLADDTVAEAAVPEAPVAHEAGSEQFDPEPSTFVDEAATEAIADEAATEAPEAAPEAEASQETEDGTEYDYEYVDDTSGVEAAAEAEPETAESMADTRRHRYESKAAIAAAERKYRFRSRMLSTMGLAILFTGIAAFSLTPTMWWVCGGVVIMTVLYLAYLRRQTRIEEQLRRRRAQRMMRSRHGVENTQDEEFDVVPSRLRRPGAVVLDIDDEDPTFEHLEYASMAQAYDLPRASGQ
ncbi:gephyrin-like molybdotransferase receptor GlpR [Mycobacterium sp. OTB74]|uniref:divisome protein SepX/GlpR n=1 Tax=Mycobacterium sp. OTB74 TaxID=1853452 RepID=UPI00247387C7|nr:gephyrin-like molybdotransferase receptor GlpR [Mycobacterium sp. OTB74]MDH6245572.1 putative membrane protein [Mycobacterium sp. OTB74]